VSPRVRTIVPLGLLLVVLGVVVHGAAAPLSNFDTYFHLRFGHEFLHGSWSLRHPGSVSTLATADWVPTQWLPEVVMAWTEDHAGLAGVAWLSGLQQVLLVLALYAAGRRWADPIAVVPVVCVALVTIMPGLSMRPQVLSYVLMSVVVSAWLRSQADGRVRWWLVPLTWLWAMVHGMWPIGILVGVVAVAGMALDRSVDRRTLIRHLAVPVLSAIAAALTPVGPALYPAVLGVTSRREFFAEWAAPDYTTVPPLALALLAAVLLTLVLRRGHLTWSDTTLVLLAGALSVYTSRTLPLAAVLLVPLTCRALQLVLPARTPPPRWEVATVGAFAVVGLGVLMALVPSTSDQPPAEPAWVAPALAALPDGTVVANDWAWGGYLMWRYPHLDLLMHGYGDTFTVTELQRNTGLRTLDPGWQSALAGTGARVALLPPGSRLAAALVTTEGWHSLHRSADIEMLVAPSGWPD
jgi:hypothetical protein